MKKSKIETKKTLTKSGTVSQPKIANLKLVNKPAEAVSSLQIKGSQQQKQKVKTLRKLEASDVEMTNEQAQPARVSIGSSNPGQAQKQAGVED